MAEATVSQHAEESGFNRLRADMWKMACDMSLNPTELIQKVLDLVGPELDVSRACYNECQRRRAVCTQEWCDIGVKSSIGSNIPRALMEVLSADGAFVFSSENVESKIPRALHPVTIPVIRALIKALSLKSVLTVPFHADGELLSLLGRERRVAGTGVDFDIQHVIDVIDRGHDVLQADIDAGLAMIPDGTYDYAVLGETLQVVRRPQFVLKEMLRVAEQGLVSFPNFANWSYRLHLATRGRMPKSNSLPFEWYNTPNIHLFTLKDFASLCEQDGIRILDLVCVPASRADRVLLRAGFCNLGAEKVLAVLDDPRLVAPSLCSVDRLNTKFGWLREYRKDLEMWSNWLALTDRALDIVRRRGYCSSTADDVKQALIEISDTPETELLKHELLEIVNAESSKASAGMRIPGSTEILESSFGKLKEIEGDHSRSGFTSLILVWAALFGATTSEVIRQALTEVPVKLVHTWVRRNLGTTIQSKRAKLAHALRSKSTENSEER